MEKPGMVRGYPRQRAGLLGFLVITGLSLGLPAVKGDEGLSVSLGSSPPEPVVGLPWTVSILVDHPYPAEVTVTPPILPVGLRIDRVRTGSRAAGITGKRRTEVEFTFIPLRRGSLSLPPFAVHVPGKQALTPELGVYVGDPSEEVPDSLRGFLPGEIRRYQPRLVWESRPSSLRPGEAGEIRLVLTGRDLRIPLPDPSSCRPPVPVNAILDELPLSAAGREEEVLFRFLVIPLGGDEVVFPARTLRYGTETLEIPDLRIPVLPAAVLPGTAGAAGKPVPADPSGGEAAPEMEAGPAPEVPFPEFPPGRLFPFRGAYERVLAPVHRLWDAGFRAEALALLRRNERDTPIGPALAPVRRAAEASLGLSFRKNESFRGLFTAAGAAVLILCLMILAFYLFRKKIKGKSVTSPGSWGYRIALIALIPLLALGIFVFYRAGEGMSVSGKGKSAVLRQTGVYRVPDSAAENSGEVSGTTGPGFAEGEPVLIRSSAGSWVYVESPDGRAGWVPAERLVSY